MGIGNPMMSCANHPTGRLLELGLTQVARVMSCAMASSLPVVQELATRVEGYRGKMVRPTMVLLAGLAAGDPEELNLSRLGLAIPETPGKLATSEDPALNQRLTERHFTIGAVIEMIHLATLVHDDVLDEADLRRGSPTIARLRGNEPAVMLGDYLISRAFELCASAGDAAIAHRVGQISSRVCEGEIMQLAHRDDLELDEPTYFDIIERKTACLIGLAAELGARCSGADDSVQRAAFEFGQQVGIAFQIQDDLLDLIGQEQQVGKSLGKDLDKGKLTLPMIRHISALPHHERSSFIAELRAGAFINGSRGRLAKMLDASGSIASARATAAHRIDRAKAALSSLPPTPPADELRRMADAVITRSW